MLILNIYFCTNVIFESVIPIIEWILVVGRFSVPPVLGESTGTETHP